MNFFGGFGRQLTWEVVRVIDWAMHNWGITMIILILLIYWAGRQKRLNRHHL